MIRKCNLLFSVSTIVSMASGSVWFTKVPPNPTYVYKGGTARFDWEYHVDDRNSEFDINSPRWNFYTRQGYSMNIASEDIFKNWTWIIHKDTCPPRLLNPRRVFKELQATLVIQNVTTDDGGVYECSLVLLRTSLPINSRVNLVVLENVTVRLTNSTQRKQLSLPLKENVTNLFTNSTKNKQLLLPVRGTKKDIPIINRNLSDRTVFSWNNHVVSLRCILNEPVKTNITWYSPNGSDVTHASRSVPRGSEISINTTEDNDYGEYTCHVEDIQGFDELKIKVLQICLCPSAKSMNQVKLAFMKRKVTGEKQPKPSFNRRKSFYIVCYCAIGISWIVDAFLIFISRSISKRLQNAQ